MGRLDELSSEERAVAEPEGGGIDVQQAMIWAHAALKGKVRMDSPPPGLPSSDTFFFNGGSGNMRGLYTSLWYFWHPLAAVHRQRLLNFLAQNEKVHGLEETGTLSATHAQLWCGLLFFALWAAAKAGDKQVADALIRYLAIDFALWQALSVGGPVPDVWSPGARAKDTARKGSGELMGSNSARTACWRLIDVLDPVAGSWQRKIVHVGDNAYNLGPLALRETPKEIIAQIKAERPDLSRVRMCRPFHVRRWPSRRDGVMDFGVQDYIAWFEPPLPVAAGARGDAPAHAAGVLDGVRWIQAFGDEESLYPHLSRYPTTAPSLTIDMEGPE